MYMIVKYYYIICLATQYNTVLVIHRIDTCVRICAFMNTSLMMQIIFVIVCYLRTSVRRSVY
jgi:hypothetical protein